MEDIKKEMFQKFVDIVNDTTTNIETDDVVDMFWDTYEFFDSAERGHHPFTRKKVAKYIADGKVVFTKAESKPKNIFFNRDSHLLTWTFCHDMSSSFGVLELLVEVNLKTKEIYQFLFLFTGDPYE